MANLNFKMGLHAGLANVTASTATAGTLYVTTDEKAIYLDVPTLADNGSVTGAERIRLGQIIIWNTEEWAKSEPPYSTEAFYYVSDANALLRHNGTEWIQINSVSDLEADISNLTKDVSELKKTTENLSTSLTSLNSQVNHTTTGLAATKTIADQAKNTADAALPKSDFETFKSVNSAAIDDVDTKITNYIKNNNTEITNIKNNYATKDEAQNYAANEAAKVLGTTNDVSSTLTVHGVKKYAESILGKSTDAASVNTVYGAKAAATAAQNTANTANTAIATMQSGATIKTFKGLEDKIDGLTTNDIGGMSNYATVEQLNTAKTAILGTKNDGTDFEGTVKEAYQKADTNATAITELQSKLQVADALVYQGTVEGEYKNNTTILTFSDLNFDASELKIGYTYKVTNEFILDNTQSSTDADINIYVGDLLIATGTENSSTGYITSNLKWDHIPSGYVAEYVPNMDIAYDSSTQATLRLTSAHADTDELGDLGSVLFQCSENINLTPISASNKTVGIEFGLVWGTF